MTKNKKKVQPKAPPLSRRLLDGLIRAESLRKQGKLNDALKFVQELEAQHPNQYEVLVLMLEVGHELDDFLAYEWAAYQLSRLKPGNPDLMLGLAGAYLLTNQPGLALRTYQAVLKRWPDHARGPEIRKTVDNLRATLLREMNYPALSEADLLELAAEHDEVLFLMRHNQLRQCKHLAEKLLKTHPDLAPVMNNLAQVHLLEGNHTEARRLALRVLEIEPDNLHALAHLVRILFLSGDFSGAREMAQRQITSPSQAVVRWARLAETYSLLDDNQSLVELVERAEQVGVLEASPESALVLHHAAVALVRLGKEQQARSLWQKALQFLPSFDLPRQNLADLDLPAGQRNGPWAYDLSLWVPAPVTQEMVRILRGPVKSNNSAATENAARIFLQRRPELVALLPHLLARGDADTRQFAIRLIKLAETPDLIALLKDFALGDRGTDEIRLDAMQFLTRQGYLPTGSYPVWIKGKWSDILQLNFEITSDPVLDFKLSTTGKLALQAVDALLAQNGAQAQALIEKALEMEQTPSLLNNLALALEMQGQTEQAHAIADSIHTRFPDYFFGISAAARMAIVRGDLDEAQDLLTGLTQRSRMHKTEYDALCEAQIHLAMARKNLEGARSWLQMWEKVNPNDPRLVEYNLVLSGPKLLDLMHNSLKKSP